MGEQVGTGTGGTGEPVAARPRDAGWAPPPGQPPPWRTGWLFAIGVGIGTMLALVAAGFFLAARVIGVWAEPEVGSCIAYLGTHNVSVMGPLLVGCDNPLASQRIVGVREEPLSAGYPQECPEETDLHLQLRPKEVLCVRNLDPPHPGDPGQGGGVMRAGDCVLVSRDQGLVLQEVPCGEQHPGETVVRVSDGACPVAAPVEVEVRATPRRVLCLSGLVL